MRLNKIYAKIKDFIVINYKFLLLIIGINLLFLVELPYVIYRPGGTVNLSERISVENGFASKGRIQMAYVSMMRGSIPFVVVARFMPNWDIASKSEITMEDETISDMMERDRIYLEQSINNATIIAYREAGKHLDIKESISTVVFISSEADTNLRIGDQLTHVNGEEIGSLDEYREIVETHEVGSTLELTIRRNDRERDAWIKVFETEEGLRTGISVITTYELEMEPPLTIRSRARESGPSGGLMLALGIYDALGKEDITKGRNIVGTGTITKDGEVGEIGGVRYKLMGAVRNRADIFICPQENYDEAVRVKRERNFNIIIIGASTFAEALEKLREI